MYLISPRNAISLFEQQVIYSSSKDGGLWNGPKVAKKISELVGRPVSRQRSWKYLKNQSIQKARCQVTGKMPVPR